MRATAPSCANANDNPVLRSRCKLWANWKYWFVFFILFEDYIYKSILEHFYFQSTKNCVRMRLKIETRGLLKHLNKNVTEMLLRIFKCTVDCALWCYCCEPSSAPSCVALLLRICTPGWLNWQPPVAAIFNIPGNSRNFQIFCTFEETLDSWKSPLFLK